MTSNVLHSSSSAENLWEEAESRIAEATMIRIWRLNVTEVCQAVSDSVFHVEEDLETKKKIERAFEIVLSCLSFLSFSFLFSAVSSACFHCLSFWWWKVSHQQLIYAISLVVIISAISLNSSSEITYHSVTQNFTRDASIINQRSKLLLNYFTSLSLLITEKRLCFWMKQMCLCRRASSTVIKTLESRSFFESSSTIKKLCFSQSIESETSMTQFRAESLWLWDTISWVSTQESKSE